MTSRRMTMVLMLAAVVAAGAFARNYDLDEAESVDLSGVSEIVVDLNGLRCALCIRTVNLESEISGDGAGGRLDLSLTGRVGSNKAAAVPTLDIDERRGTLTIRLFPERKVFFGLSQSGTAVFRAVLPRSFQGTLSVTGSSQDVEAHDIDLEEASFRVSSGDLGLRNIAASVIDVSVSSGDMVVDQINARGELSLDSSSGEIEIATATAGTATIKSSSGDITIGSITSEGQVSVGASSGRIEISESRSGDLVLDTSSGKITVGSAKAGDVEIDVSSGDVDIDALSANQVEFSLSSGELEARTLEAQSTEIRTSGDVTINAMTGSLKVRGTSGDVEVGVIELTREIDIDVSSGNVTLSLPKSSGFEALIDTSSGRIRSEFAIMGDLTGDNDRLVGSVNGGDIKVTAKTSSGNVTIREQ